VTKEKEAVATSPKAAVGDAPKAKLEAVEVRERVCVCACVSQRVRE